MLFGFLQMAEPDVIIDVLPAKDGRSPGKFSTRRRRDAQTVIALLVEEYGKETLKDSLETVVP